MLSRLRVMLVTVCLFVCVGVFSIPARASAECEITSVFFDQGQQYFDGSMVPFAATVGSDNAHKRVIINTNNDPSCEGREVYVAIFAKNQQSVALKEANGKQHYKLTKSGEISGSDEFSLAISYGSAEEACYDNTIESLKERIEKSTSGKDFKTLLNYLEKDEKKKALYGYLFDIDSYKTNYTDITVGTSLNSPVPSAAPENKFGYALLGSHLWEAKKIMYNHFDKSVDCAYYARAQLDKPIDTTVGFNTDGDPVAVFSSKDLGVAGGTKVNYIGYMCKVDALGYIQPDTESCGDSEYWYERGGNSYSGGKVLTGDPCIPDGNPTPGCYELLAPIPGLGTQTPEGDTVIYFDGFNGAEPFALEKFFLAAINVVVGASSVLAVLAILMYGFNVMNARSVGNVPNLSKYKARLWSVFWGLAIILGSYVILNTINPELLDIGIDLRSVSLGGTVDNLNADDSIAPSQGGISVYNSGKGFNMFGSFEQPQPSPGSKALLEANKALKQGAKITKIVADIGSGSETNGIIYFYLDNNMVASAPIRTGPNGVAEVGAGKQGDRRTPKGKYTLSPIKIAKSQDNAVLFSKSINVGAGAAGFSLDGRTAHRGIYIHGKGTNALATTLGCLRMYNDDIMLIFPYLIKGTQLIVE